MKKFTLIVILTLSGYVLSLPIAERIGLTKINSTPWTCCNLASFGQPIETYLDHQYTVFYDNLGNVCVARRHVFETQWDTLRVGGYKTTTSDGHNTPVIGLSPIDGTIHIAFDHHNDPLHYSASVKNIISNPDSFQWTGALFGPIKNSSIMPTLNVVTYPHFLTRPDGVLQFITRLNGGSGNADWALWEYKADSSKWVSVGMILSQQGTYTWPDGYVDNDRCAYPNGYTYHGNRLHMTWCWREDCCRQNANHDLLYAYSDDFGRTWKNSNGDSAGATGTNPLKLNSNGIKVWDIPVNRGYINQVCQNVDSKGRIHVVTWHIGTGAADNQTYYPTNGFYFHYWRDTTGLWHRDSLMAIQQRCKLLFNNDDDAFLVTSAGVVYSATAASNWSDWKLVINENTGGGEPTVDFSRWKNSSILSLMSASLSVLDYSVSDTSWPYIKIGTFSSIDSTPIAGVAAGLYKNGTSVRGGQTSASGYSLFRIWSGTYDAVVSALGFEKGRHNSINVSGHSGDTTVVKIYLNALTITGIRITPNSTTMTQSDTAQLTVLSTFSDTSETKTREKVEWISRSPSLLKVDSTGRIISQGTAGYVWIIASISKGLFIDSTLITINTVEVISPIQDAYVRDGSYAATNFGTEQVISAKTGGAGYSRRAYLKFDLSSLKGKNVEGATLSMTLTATDITATMPVTFYEVTDNSWTETAINWNNKPAHSTALDTVIVENSVGTIYYWSLDAWVKANKGLSEASLCFLDPSNTDKHAVFGSRENSANAPKLLVMVNSGSTAVQNRTKAQRTELAVIPNPFNPVTRILLPSITAKDKASVSLCIFSSDGKLIADLSNAAQQSDSVLWNGQHQPSGIYLLQVKIGNSTLNRRITLLK